MKKFLLLLLLFTFTKITAAKIEIFSFKSQIPYLSTELFESKILTILGPNTILPYKRLELYKQAEIDTNKINFDLEDSLNINYIIIIKIDSYNIKNMNKFLPFIKKTQLTVNYFYKIYSVKERKVVLAELKPFSTESKYFISFDNYQVISSEAAKNLLPISIENFLEYLTNMINIINSSNEGE